MELFTEVAGGGPVVVLVHAGVCDSRMWEPQWASWPRGHRVVRYDLRGFGRSPLPPEPFSHGRDLLDLIWRLGAGPVSLVGASLGGRVALEVAVSHPGVVDALVLVDAALPGHAWSEEMQAFGAEEDAALERGDIDAAVEVNLRMWVDGRPPGVADPALRAFVGEMQRRAFELQVPVGEEAAESPLEPHLDDRIGEIVAPTLVVAGDRDQPDFLTIAARLAREIRGARSAVIAGAAHLPSLERPAEFDELVLGFLAGAQVGRAG